MGDGLDPNRILRFVAAERITVIPFLAPTKVERDALPAGEVGEIAVRGTSTIRLKAEFDNKDNALWPGFAVTTALQLGVDKGVLIVPDEVVQHGQSGLYVFIIDDQNRAKVRQVKIATRTRSRPSSRMA